MTSFNKTVDKVLAVVSFKCKSLHPPTLQISVTTRLSIHLLPCDEIGSCPISLMIISQKSLWLEEFPEALRDGLQGVFFLTLLMFFYPVLHITVITRVKPDQSFLSSKMMKVFVYFLKYVPQF